MRRRIIALTLVFLFKAVFVSILPLVWGYFLNNYLWQLGINTFLSVLFWLFWLMLGATFNFKRPFVSALAVHIPGIVLLIEAFHSCLASGVPYALSSFYFGAGDFPILTAYLRLHYDTHISRAAGRVYIVYIIVLAMMILLFLTGTYIGKAIRKISESGAELAHPTAPAVFSGRPVSVPYDVRGLKSTHIRSGRTLAGHFRDVGDAVPYGLLNCYSRGMGGAQDRGEER